MGHLLRQKSDTPIRKSLADAASAVRRPRRAPRETRYSLIKKVLEKLRIKIEGESTWGTVLDRSQWKRRESSHVNLTESSSMVMTKCNILKI